MYTTITLILLFNYTGIIASAIGGVITAKKMGLQSFSQFLSGIFTSLGGGIFLRDLILLQIAPVISPLELIVAITTCIFTIIILRYREPGNVSLFILCLFNSIGIVGSTVTGYNQGAKANFLIAFMCSFTTACGGSMLATIIQTTAHKKIKTLFTILVHDKWYYFFVAFMSIIYGILRSSYNDTNITITTLITFSIVIGFIVRNKK